MPEPDLHHDLAAIAAHGSRVLRPRPVADVVRRGRQRRRHQRIAATTGLAAVVLGIAGGTVLLTGDRPGTVAPAAPPAVSPVPSPSPLPADVLSGSKAVTLRTSDGAPVVAGYDDDDRVIVQEVEGKDQDRRDRWLLRPAAGEQIQLVQATKRPGGEVCAAEEDRALRVRLCDAGDEHQRFTLVPVLHLEPGRTPDPEADRTDSYLLRRGSATVTRDADDGLVTGGGTVVILTVG
ncbi:hypothetical protein [Actinoplanes sp. RD1]|uniref:hypothetical protein n=1 Tax=Actinoplanes sp. RD1 TaxID=3064538 RepID=UPI002740C2B8|nr:hypothetical protein [Actinoplanes sp. RD1]